MIKLIASDMDGTLLNDAKELPPRLPQMIRQLEEKKIDFVIASGRQYYNLAAQFPGLAEHMDFIAENGGMVVCHGEVVYIDQMEQDDVCKIVETIRQTPGCFPILCGAKSAYLEDRDPTLLEHAHMYYARMEIIDDVLAAQQTDTICKIAVFHDHDAEHVALPAMMRFADSMQVALSGECWVDLMRAGIHKGNAYQKLMEVRGAAPEECMAFGDYLNDIQLMQACGERYAMANAHPELAAQCNHTAPSNEEDGVVRTTEQLFNLDLS